MALMGSWHMNSGWTDSSGNGYDFTTIVGAIIDNVNQHLGAGCGSLDGIDDHARQELPAGLKATNVTYGAWIKLGDNTRDEIWLAGVPTGSANDGRGFSLKSNAGRVQCLLGTGDGSFTSIIGTTVMDEINYHRLVATYDGANVRVFLDGVYEGVIAEAGGILWDDKPTGLGPDPAQLYIGGSRNNTAGVATNYAFGEGLIDEANIFDHAMTYGGVSVGQVAGGEIAEDYNGGAGVELPISEIKSFRGLGKGLMKGLGRGL